jgi:hypothetical protein
MLKKITGIQIDLFVPMNVNFFYSRNLDERLALVNSEGEFISKIKYYGFLVNLYVVENELVEVFYNIHSKTIEEVELLDPAEPRLKLYVAGVDISGLFKSS